MKSFLTIFSNLLNKALDDIDSTGAEQSERLRNLLEKGAPVVISQKHIEAVSDKLTADKLASIKTKIRTRRRNQIADTDILSGLFETIILIF